MHGRSSRRMVRTRHRGGGDKYTANVGHPLDLPGDMPLPQPCHDCLQHRQLAPFTAHLGFHHQRLTFILSFCLRCPSPLISQSPSPSAAPYFLSARDQLSKAAYGRRRMQHPPALSCQSSPSFPPSLPRHLVELTSPTSTPSTASFSSPFCLKLRRASSLTR